MSSQLNAEQRLLCDFCANILFDKNVNPPENFDVTELLKEAMHQTVLPIVCTGLKNLSLENDTSKRCLYNTLAYNMRGNYNSAEICKLLKENSIQYVILKGISSADYYSLPLMRSVGDVDVLIAEKDIGRVDGLLRSIGYSTADDMSNPDRHIGYKRTDKGIKSTCEVHLRINGIPESLNDVFGEYFNEIFDDSREIDVSNVKCFVPSSLHHGLILLLHTASHMTGEGIGLRHLCDWAVFVNSFSDEEFTALFNQPLSRTGLWRFAELLTLCCIKFLGVENKKWCGQADDRILDGILQDIITGGNFGYKDMDRYGQAKYIKNRKTQSIKDSNTIASAGSNISEKAKEYAFVKRYKILLPLGWIAVVLKYVGLVIVRRRKIDSVRTINDAKIRKSIYSEFKLFEVD